MLRPLHRLLAWLGTRLLSLRLPLTEYGLFLVFRFGTAAQADGYIQAALQERARRQPVILVPVVTDAGGVPVAPPAPKGDGYAN